MALRDAQRLFDILIRLQIYVECVKVSQAREFAEVLNAVDTEFRKILLRVKYPTLDGLTKLELNKLVVLLRQSQSKVYTLYTKKLIKRLEDFTKASLKVNRIAYAAVFNLDVDDELEVLSDDDADTLIQSANEESDFIALFGLAAISQGGESKMWARIRNEPLPATGSLPLPFITSLTTSAQLGTENLIRKAYSNSWTPNQTVVELDSQLAKVVNQSVAVESTLIQHVESVVSAGIASALFGRYRWVSVIDSGTTDICISRNKRTYAYGSGPLRPAHVRCRSIVVPEINGVDDKPDDSFFAFISRQTQRVQTLALGSVLAKKLRSGNLKAKDVRLDPEAMTIEGFADSAEEIITG